MWQYPGHLISEALKLHVCVWDPWTTVSGFLGQLDELDNRCQLRQFQLFDNFPNIWRRKHWNWTHVCQGLLYHGVWFSETAWWLDNRYYLRHLCASSDSFHSLCTTVWCVASCLIHRIHFWTIACTVFVDVSLLLLDNGHHMLTFLWCNS